MRRGLVALAAALVLLPGCHQYWGGSYGSGGLTPGAQANVRSAIPAIEAWYADNGTYAGMSVDLLKERYDPELKALALVGPLNAKTYCVESAIGSESFFKAGPGAQILEGRCGDPVPHAQVAPPPPSYDPVTNIRAAIPAIEAYNADKATYAGMTVKLLRETYDYGIPEVEIVQATKTTYCIESTVAGETFSRHGPTADIVAGGC
jgi:hypothetical protein